MRGIARANHLVFLVLLHTVLCAQTIWTIKNPSPPWDDFLGVHFINSLQGWAVGESGYIVRTTNGGIEWNTIGNGFAPLLTSVQFIDDYNGWIAGSSIYKTDDGGLSWEYSIGGVGNFRSLFFVDSMQGYGGTGSGKIFRTLNGGDSWEKVYEYDNTIKGLIFTDQNSGWALSRYVIIKTIDSGNNWTVIDDFPGSIGQFNDFQFMDEYLGWVVSSNGSLFFTFDGGGSWEVYPGPAGSTELVALHFFDELDGRLFTENNCFITNDGGLTYEEAGGEEMNTRAVFFPDSTFGCTVGTDFNFSNDAGINWNTTARGHTYDQFAVCMGQGTQIYTGSWQESIMFSSDNGVNWENLELQSDPIFDIFFTQDSIIWACGKDGMLIYSEDMGENWYAKATSTFNDLNAISFCNADTGYVVGWNIILATSNGGNTWSISQPISNYSLNDVYCYDGNNTVICGDYGYVFKTNDAGTTWTEHFLDANPELYSICFVTNNRGWATSKGKIYSTFDGGDSWIIEMENVAGIWSKRIYSINFQDEENGWAVGQDGTLLHTRDGGINWVHHASVVEEDLRAITFRNMNEGCAVGNNGTVLFTDQGTYLAPKVVGQSGNKIVCESESVVLFCEAVGDSLQYQWFSGNGLLPGETDSLLLFDSISIFEGGLYHCKVYNGAGKVYSEKKMLSVLPLVKVTAHPGNKVCHIFDTIIFNQAVTGALPISYQWQKNSVDIPGAVNHTYTVYGVQFSDSGDYRCIVSNSCSIDTTDQAKLLVLPESSIISSVYHDKLLISPNPVRDFLYIFHLEPATKVETRVFDLSGNIIEISGRFANDHLLLEVGSLEKGVYFIVIRSEEIMRTGKFIKH